MSTQGFGSWHGQWYLADGTDGWYVVSPCGGECGPFTEEEAGAKRDELRALWDLDLAYNAEAELVPRRPLEACALREEW